jgi:hypothetical protein
LIIGGAGLRPDESGFASILAGLICGKKASRDAREITKDIGNLIR